MAVSVLCFGATPALGADTVRVTIVVILATDQNKMVDADLQCIAKQIQKDYPNLTGFHYEKPIRKDLKVGQKTTFHLIDDEIATVIVRHGADQENRIGLTVKAPLQGEIEYTTCCDKYFPLVTRYQTKDKEWLIIAVRVQPCKQQVAKP